MIKGKAESDVRFIRISLAARHVKNRLQMDKRRNGDNYWEDTIVPKTEDSELNCWEAASLFTQDKPWEVAKALLFS